MIQGAEPFGDAPFSGEFPRLGGPHRVHRPAALRADFVLDLETGRNDSPTVITSN